MQSSPQLEDISRLLTESLKNYLRLKRGKSYSLWARLIVLGRNTPSLWVSLFPFLETLLNTCNDSMWFLIFPFGHGILLGCSGSRTRIRLANTHSGMHCLKIRKKERFWRYRACNTEMWTPRPGQLAGFDCKDYGNLSDPWAKWRLSNWIQ